MYVLENPVLQRELLVNLRMTRAFVLLFLYIALLGLVVVSGLAAGAAAGSDAQPGGGQASWSICSSSASTCWRR